MTFILGINAFHGDSSACLVRDGVLVAAAEEERFRRIKHWAGFPSESIKYCLAEAGISLADVAHVAINQDSRASLGRKILYTLTNLPSPALVLDRLRNKRKRDSIETHLQRAFPGQAFGGLVHQFQGGGTEQEKMAVAVTRRPALVDDAPQGLEQVGRVLDLVDHDQLAPLLAQIGVGIGEAEAVGGPLQVQIHRAGRPVGRNAPGQRGLAHLAGAEQDDGGAGRKPRPDGSFEVSG